MKKIAIIGLILCLAASPAFALAAGTLRAEGVATLSIVPDQAVLNVGYAAENAESGEAQRQVADAVAWITEEVKAAGVEEADISTSSFNIYPVYSYSDVEPQVRGYRVEHMLSVTVKDIDAIGDVMNAALNAGANQAYGITFGTSHEKDVYLQALAVAVTNAQAKADALAIASGVWLGALEQINELSSMNYYAPMPYMAEKADMERGASFGGTIMKGQLNVTAAVELVYGIR